MVLLPQEHRGDCRSNVPQGPSGRAGRRAKDLNRQRMLFDYSVKLEINSKKITRRYLNIQELDDVFLNNPWAR